MTLGIVLLGHGSRDPRWREPIEAVARRAAGIAAHVAVRCAYLELAEPDLATAAASLIEGDGQGAGITELRVVPMFLGMGKHAREDLPRLVDALRIAHPQVQVELQRAVGEHEAVIDLLAKIALQAPGHSQSPSIP